jgi:hypothetical protein
MEGAMWALLLSLPLFVLGFSTKTTKDGSIMDFGGGRAGGRGQTNRERESRGGRMMMIAAGGSGRTDGGDAAEIE